MLVTLVVVLVTLVDVLVNLVVVLVTQLVFVLCAEPSTVSGDTVLGSAPLHSAGSTVGAGWCNN